jgi:hypothetical protein
LRARDGDSLLGRRGCWRRCGVRLFACGWLALRILLDAIMPPRSGRLWARPAERGCDRWCCRLVARAAVTAADWARVPVWWLVGSRQRELAKLAGGSAQSPV